MKTKITFELFFINLHDAVKRSVSLMNYNLTIANFDITSTNIAFSINAILVNVLFKLFEF